MSSCLPFDVKNQNEDMINTINGLKQWEKEIKQEDCKLQKSKDPDTVIIIVILIIVTWSNRYIHFRFLLLLEDSLWKKRRKILKKIFKQREYLHMIMLHGTNLLLK